MRRRRGMEAAAGGPWSEVEERRGAKWRSAGGRSGGAPRGAAQADAMLPAGVTGGEGGSNCEPSHPDEPGRQALTGAESG